jgi:hypothetical protein
LIDPWVVFPLPPPAPPGEARLTLLPLVEAFAEPLLLPLLASTLIALAHMFIMTGEEDVELDPGVDPCPRFKLGLMLSVLWPVALLRLVRVVAVSLTRLVFGSWDCCWA